MINLNTALELLVAIIGGIGFVNYWSYRNYKNSQYTYLDNLWLEMLKLYRENPKFLNKDVTNNYRKVLSEEEIEKYNVFALTLQSTMETIFDIYRGKIPDEWLYIYRFHSDLHRSWLSHNTNSFRPKFINNVGLA